MPSSTLVRGRPALPLLIPVGGLTALLVFAASSAPAQSGAPDFAREVAPLLTTRCVVCHSGAKPQAGFRVTNRAALLRGGVSGPALTPETPERSRLLAAIRYEGPRMPPQGKLPAPEIAVLTRWIRAGAPWPGGDAAGLEPAGKAGPPRVTPEAMRFWSFRPVRPPAVPAVKDPAWAQNPVDAFIRARLEASGLQPNPAADRPALLRRVTYDLTGLPPTPEELREFVADRSPDAWEKVVDRLLASPHYGEKWGRHWLDLVRFAETNSYERDGPKPSAWRYRDYVIRSLNEDKPYDRFLTEQIAGDEIAPRTPERLIATGYYRLGIWDDEPVDGEQALYDDLDDIVRTTGEVFLGLTVGCARCHDHKLDPIPAKDYYRFLAFFNGVQRFGARSAESVEANSLRPLGSPEETRTQRAAIAAHAARLRAVQEGIQPIEMRVQRDLQPVEREDWQVEARRLSLVQQRVPRLLTQAEYARHVALVEEREQLRVNPPPALAVALCVTEVGAQARDTFLLLRGSPKAKADPVQPGVLSVLGFPDPKIEPAPFSDTSGRRLALARWLTRRDNPLTARVLANRVWQHHFGRGIVGTPNDFGFQGDKPTHPELLDWLADQLMQQGWRLKPLHRQILLSRTYRMASRSSAAASAKDPENHLLWRFPPRRLLAEELRDSILFANGTLNRRMGGPSVYPEIPAEVQAGQSIPGSGWGRSSLEEQARRTVYAYVKRSLILPAVAAFDGPETDFTCPVRFSTTQPTQALGLLNSTWMNRQAAIFAAYLRRHAGPAVDDQVRAALLRVTQREPSRAQVERGRRLIERLRTQEKLSPDAALAGFCLVALNLNEFLYLD